MAEFTHLHLHTEFSLLDGMGRIQDYIAGAQSMGMNHMAVTDHGVMYGAMDWYKAATKAGMHPIIGMEAYLAEGSVSDRQRDSYHLLLLAENETGYHNLIRLASEASINGFYYRPRIDLEMLQQHGSGIIATSACLGGPVAKNYLNNKPEKAREYAATLGEIFGKERFYIELQDHGLPEQHLTNRLMVDLAQSLGLPLVATNDVHYCNQHDAPAQDILICVGTNTNINDPKRLKQDTDQFYLKSPAEMELLFSDLPEALSNTMRIAEMCNVNLEFGGYQLPEFETPPGLSSEEYLRQLCTEGVLQRYGSLEGRVGERLDYELGVISRMGFTNYFLIVWDFVTYAKSNGILVGPGRGSAASSIVTYSLGITGLDPLEHNLMFERFLNPSRITMPDIDIDFDHIRRDEVINYVTRKYGEDRVAGIGTFGTLKAKAAIKDCARAMEYSVAEASRVAAMIPADPKATIDKALEEVPEFKKVYSGEPRVRELVDTARKVEGLSRHPGKHAAGVIISRDPLVEHVPLQMTGKGRTDVTTQWTMGHLEELGLLKMDFLGLKTLSVVGGAVERACKAGADISIESIPMEDDKMFELLQRGDTFGVFQLEGGMTTRMTVDVQPKNFDDIIALMALIRPGPMELAPDYIGRKHGRLKIEYPHPLLEDVLKETYGIALYQEQVMQIANVLAGFSMADADGLRKAMGKKLPHVMAEYKDQFVQGAAEKGVSEKDANAVWDLIEKFAGYGFVKSHSAAYGVIAAQTAYLKAHYPAQFMASLMSAEIDSSEKTVINVGECLRAGIGVLPPDINKSDVDFSVEILPDGKEAVRFGLGAIKGIGHAAAENIIASRDAREGRTFSVLQDFSDDIDWSIVSKKTVESLVKAGAFDLFGHRAQVMKALESLAISSQVQQKARDRGQMNLFGALSRHDQGDTGFVMPEVLPASQPEVLEWEREVLGFYLSSHPIREIIGNDIPAGFRSVASWKESPGGTRTKSVVMIKSLRRITTRSNRTMAIMEVEDLTGSSEIVVFPKTYDEYGHMFNTEAIVVIEGRVDDRDDRHQMVMESLSQSLPHYQPPAPVLAPVVFEVFLGGEQWEDIEILQKIDEIIWDYSGDHTLELMIHLGDDVRLFRSRSRKVEWSPMLQAKTSELGDKLTVWLRTDISEATYPIDRLTDDEDEPEVD